MWLLVCRKGMAVLYVDNGRCPDGTVDYSLKDWTFLSGDYYMKTKIF